MDDFDAELVKFESEIASLEQLTSVDNDNDNNIDNNNKQSVATTNNNHNDNVNTSSSVTEQSTDNDNATTITDSNKKRKPDIDNQQLQQGNNDSNRRSISPTNNNKNIKRSKTTSALISSAPKLITKSLSNNNIQQQSIKTSTSNDNANSLKSNNRNNKTISNNNNVVQHNNTTTPLQQFTTVKQQSIDTAIQPHLQVQQSVTDQDSSSLQAIQPQVKLASQPVVRAAGGEIWVDNTLSEWPSNDYRLFVGDLSNEVTDSILTNAFNHYTSFYKARVVRDKHSGKTKGYGFASFLNEDDAIHALKYMNNKIISSRPIKLKKSNWNQRNLDNRIKDNTLIVTNNKNKNKKNKKYHIF